MQRDRLIVYEMCDVWPAFAKRIVPALPLPLFSVCFVQGMESNWEQKIVPRLRIHATCAIPVRLYFKRRGGGRRPFFARKGPSHRGTDREEGIRGLPR